MPIIPKYRKPKSPEAVKPQSLAAAYGIRRTMGAKRPSFPAAEQTSEAPASVAEMVMRKRKANSREVEPADSFEDDASIFEDQNEEAVDFADEGDAADSMDEMDMIDRIRAKRKAAQGL